MADDDKAAKHPKDVMTCISEQISDLSAGDRAALRRIFLTRRHEADGIVIGLINGAGLNIPSDPKFFAPWRLLTHVGAILSGTARHKPHAPNGNVGSLLFAAGYSENRLLRLVSARSIALHGQIIRAVRSLPRAKDPPINSVNLWTLFHLAGPDPDRAEEARTRIAQDYYTAVARSEGDSK